MRLPEKTLELNFSAQLSELLGRRLFCFGLTNRQERRAGFDVATRLAARVLLFQMKASKKEKKNGARQFRAAHHQMRALQMRCRSDRMVFYVFPLVSTTQELRPDRWIMDDTWLLDVSAIPDPIPHPTVKGGGRLRKSGIHYIDVWPGRAIVHSEPHQCRLLKVSGLVELIQSEPEGLRRPTTTLEEFETLCEQFSGTAIGIIL